eukprot:7244680-Pyramimonas_sp.AAC.1
MIQSDAGSTGIFSRRTYRRSRVVSPRACWTRRRRGSRQLAVGYEKRLEVSTSARRLALTRADIIIHEEVSGRYVARTIMPLLCEEKGNAQPIAVAAKYEDVRANRASRMEIRHSCRKEPRRRKGLVPFPERDSRPYCCS